MPIAKVTAATPTTQGTQGHRGPDRVGDAGRDAEARGHGDRAVGVRAVAGDRRRRRGTVRCPASDRGDRR